MADEELNDAELAELVRALQSRKPIRKVDVTRKDRITEDLSEKVFDPCDVVLECRGRFTVDDYGARVRYTSEIINVTIRVPEDLTNLTTPERDTVVVAEAVKVGIGSLRGASLKVHKRRLLMGIHAYVYCDTKRMAKIRREFNEPIMRR